LAKIIKRGSIKKTIRKSSTFTMESTKNKQRTE
jgi:hypothetical protein